MMWLLPLLLLLLLLQLLIRVHCARLPLSLSCSHLKFNLWCAAILFKCIKLFITFSGFHTIHVSTLNYYYTNLFGK